MARDPRLDDIPRSVNEIIQSRAIKHGVLIERFKAFEVRRILALYDQTLPDLLDRIEVRLGRIAERGFDPGPATTERLQQMAAAIDKATQELRSESLSTLTSDMVDLAGDEAAFQVGVIRQSLPVSFDMVLPSAQTLRSVVAARPFDGRLLKDWFRGLETAQRVGMKQAIRLGITEGETTPQIVRRLRGTRALKFTDGVVGLNRRQAEAVVRSAVTHVSSHAREATFEANTDLVKGVEIISTLDSRTCPECQALDGKVFEVGKGRRPPFHVSCFPGDTLVTARHGITGVSVRRYDGEVVVIRTASGKKLTSTPNHPILTRRGWVAAGLLKKGDDVVCDAGGDRVPLGVDGDHKDMPARIEDVAQAAFCSREMVAMPMPTTTEDFHGDGMDGQIAVVAANRLLADRTQASLPEQCGKISLVMRDMRLVLLSCLRRLAKLGLGGHPALGCVMCGGHLSPSGGLVHLGPFHGLCFGSATLGDTKIAKDAADDLPGNSVSVGQCFLRHARLIFGGNLALRQSQAPTRERCNASLAKGALHRFDTEVQRASRRGDGAEPAECGDHLVSRQILPVSSDADALLLQNLPYVGGCEIKSGSKISRVFAGFVSTDNIRRDSFAAETHLFKSAPLSHATFAKRSLNGIVGAAKTLSNLLDAAAIGIKTLYYDRVEPNGLLSGWDSGPSEPVKDRAFMDVELARQILGGSTGPVILDDVVDISRRKFAGHVFNLETEKAFYVAEGIIVHNCRCTTAPVLKSWKELGIDLQEAPPGTRASMNGAVPDTLTYGEWLKTQAVDIQDTALGPTRGRLFRKGEMSVESFTDRKGDLFTLDELRRREADAFEAAGV